MIFLYILLGVLLFVTLCLCIPITVTAGYKEGFYSRVRYLFFTFVLTEDKPKSEVKTEIKVDAKVPVKKSISYFNNLFRQNDLPDALSELFAFLRLILEKLVQIMRRSSMRRFSLSITVFDEDAATAAIRYGTVCAVVYPFLGYLNSLIPFKKQKTEVLCDYTGGKSSFLFDLKWRLIPLLCIKPLISFIIDYIKEKGR